MLRERIEGKWIDCFAEVFGRCGVPAGDAAAILSETQSRPVNVELAELALARLGAPFHVVVPSPRLSAPAPVRSTGASDALQRLAPVVSALAQSVFVVDLTVEGLLHAAELPDDPEGRRARAHGVERAPGDPRALPARRPALEAKVREGMRMLRGAKAMRVTSTPAPTSTSSSTARASAASGATRRSRARVAHWPGGLCLAFPAARERQRHARHGARRRQSHFQALPARRHRGYASRTTTCARSTATASTPS